MTRTRADDYRRWFEYERESHAKVLGAMTAVAEARRGAPEFRRAATLFAHIIEARRVWLFRMGGAPEGPKLEDLFPEGVSLEDLSRRLDAMHAAWSRHLATLDDAAIARPFDYRTYDGQPFRNTVEDVLTQLHGHSLYHRGQIAYLLRAMGAEPVSTDFVLWAREPIGGQGG